MNESANTLPATDTLTATVSVIVPVFNAAQTLEQCLDSILAQTYKQLEIVCINDGSTDNSAALLDAYAQHDNRVCVHHKTNGGYGSACNLGLAKARGNWISIVEPDDWIEPRMYESMLTFAASFNAQIDIIKTPYWRIVEPDTPHQRKLPCRYAGRIHPPCQPFQIAEATRIMRHHPSIWSALYRSDFLNEHEIRFPEIPGAGWADNPFLIETLCQAKNIVYLDEAFYCYREDTEDKNAAFAQKNPMMAFERWHDITDILERLNVTDSEIWSIQYKRAFRYFGIVEKAVGLDAPGIRAAALAMFERMNPEGVYAEPDISPAQKQFFAQMRGLPAPKTNQLQYAAWLAREGVAELRQTDLRQTLQLIKARIKH
ncbi:glycosyltransferase [Adlercreutzia sp. ZJ304]|uniref:glycosyltransferase n=1 Tax=Adlercreutzia sp. ZJ304 TaxID=2709791 RepID=UPI0013EC489B|nr:glycosyltransferase [Adlercreutzia sp. ZJ304]